MTFDQYLKSPDEIKIEYAHNVRETMRGTKLMCPEMNYMELAEYTADAYNAYVGKNSNVPATFILWAKIVCGVMV